MSAECYVCYKVKREEGKSPIGSCKNCSIFVCDEHGKRSSYPEYKCMMCTGGYIISNGILSHPQTDAAYTSQPVIARFLHGYLKDWSENEDDGVFIPIRSLGDFKNEFPHFTELSDSVAEIYESNAPASFFNFERWENVEYPLLNHLKELWDYETDSDDVAELDYDDVVEPELYRKLLVIAAAIGKRYQLGNLMEPSLEMMIETFLLDIDWGN